MEYDPLLAKLAVWHRTRTDAIARMLRALGEYHAGGIKTNIRFFRQILEDPGFRAGRLHTGFIDEFLLSHQKTTASGGDLEAVAVLAAALDHQEHTQSTSEAPRNSANSWLAAGRLELLR
jgi:acetyl-CoA carboxylase biotin carboxylase subunit